MDKYEVKDIEYVPQIKICYDYAVDNNIKYYRALSKTGKIYGYFNNSHVEASEYNATYIDGELWFENPNYNPELIDYRSLYDLEKEKNICLETELKELKEELNKYKTVIEAFKNL